MKVHPYINFDGRGAEAFRFYQALFGGELNVMKHSEAPEQADHIPADWGDAVLHAQLTFDGNQVMGCDAPPAYYEKPQGFSITLEISGTDEAARVFNALAEGGAVRMPLQETFWSPAFGMVVDRFGVPWMVSCVGAPVAAGAS